MATILRWLASKSIWLLLSFVSVVAILALWNELPAKLTNWQTQATNAEEVAADIGRYQSGFERYANLAVSSADTEIDRLKRAGADQLASSQQDVERRTQEAHARVLTGERIAWAAATGRTDAIKASYQAKYIELPLLERTSRLIATRRENLDRKSERASQIEGYNALVRERNELARQAQAQSRYLLCRRAPQLPGCDLVRSVRQRDATLAIERQRLQDQGNSIALLSENVRDGAEIAAKATDAYAAEARRLSDGAKGHALNQVTAAFKRYGWQAFLIVLGALLVPLAYKLFAFSVIAPMAAQAKPVRLREAGLPSNATMSGMSVDVSLGPDTELLLRSGLQSSARNIRGGDCAVLDWSIPFTCLAAGLVNLQRLQSDQPSHVSVIGGDETYRAAAITVQAGGAVVLQPRALLGVVKARGQPLVITRPWRIGWLISWITAQFRYVVFHGPCTLIVQGRNGVRIEEGASGRMIDKRLTMGFDAALAYGAARSPSFLPYWLGRASVFNDRFEGAGNYFYEERPTGAARGSPWGRGIRGISDALLSALGI